MLSFYSWGAEAERGSWPGPWVENGRAAPPAQTVWFSSTGALLPVNDPRVISSNTWVLHSVVFLGVFFYEFLFWWCDSGDPNWISLVPQEKRGSVCKKLRPSVCRQVYRHTSTRNSPFSKRTFPEAVAPTSLVGCPSVFLCPASVLGEQVSCCTGIGGLNVFSPLTGLHAQPGQGCPVHFCVAPLSTNNSHNSAHSTSH